MNETDGSRCTYVIKQGARKGQAVCQKRITKDGLCMLHYRQKAVGPSTFTQEKVEAHVGGLTQLETVYDEDERHFLEALDEENTPQEPPQGKRKRKKEPASPDHWQRLHGKLMKSIRKRAGVSGNL